MLVPRVGENHLLCLPLMIPKHQDNKKATWVKPWAVAHESDQWCPRLPSREIACGKTWRFCVWTNAPLNPRGYKRQRKERTTLPGVTDQVDEVVWHRGSAVPRRHCSSSVVMTLYAVIMSRKAAIIKQKKKNRLSRPREREYECTNTQAHEHYLLMYYDRKNKSCPSMVCIKRSEVCNLARRLELQTSSCHCWERCSGQGTLGILSAKLRTLTLKKVSVILSMPGRGQSWGQWVR